MLEVLTTNPDLATLVAFSTFIGALLTFLGTWVKSYFLFRSDITDSPLSAAESALRIQGAVMNELRKELTKSESNFKEALEAQAKAFNARIDRLRKTEEIQQREIIDLRERLTTYETANKEHKREIDEWKGRYWKLNNQHAEATAKLSVYECNSKQ